MAGAEEMSVSVERTLAFLDTCTAIESDGSIRTNIFRKDTHNDHYLNFSSNHQPEHKRGVDSEDIDEQSRQVGK